MKFLALHIPTILSACHMQPEQLDAILRGASREFGEKPDVMLMGKVPAVGATSVYPQYVGQTAVAPYYPGAGRVGAPAAMSQAAAPQQISYSPQAFSQGDVTDFGLGSELIAAGATKKFIRKPPRPHTPQVLVCPSTVQGLLITQISIMGTNILNGTDGVPIERFSEVSTAPQLLYPTIDPSTGVEFEVKNYTSGDLNFLGTFYGTQVR